MTNTHVSRIVCRCIGFGASESRDITPKEKMVENHMEKKMDTEMEIGRIEWLNYVDSGCPKLGVPS